MRIKGYKKFLTENLEMTKIVNDANVLESIVTDSETLLKSINAEQVLMGDALGFNSENYNDIDALSKDQDFLKKLDDKGFKKNNIEYSKDCETFLDKTLDIKFFLIFKKDDSELEPKPEYIVFQSRARGSNRWEPVKMYKVNENIRNFYDKLSSKTIEIKRGFKNYIFKTSNAGNDWNLQNIQNKDATFKDIMSNDEIKATLKDGGTSITIIA
jgi:hypothetical protein